MNFKECRFKKPVKVLQVFKQIHIYGKENKSFESRKEVMKWNDFNSANGYVKEKELFIPEYLIDNARLNESALITLEDSHFISSNNFPKPNLSNSFPYSKRYSIDIFDLHNNLDIFLKYDKYEVGIPSRANFKLCELTEQIPVEIKINGKIDFTASRGRERMFKEQQYIFQYLGEFDSYKILKQPFTPILKTIPSDRKLIDLIKPLW